MVRKYTIILLQPFVYKQFITYSYINCRVLWFGGLTVGIDNPITLTAPITVNKTTFDLVNNLTISGTMTDAGNDGITISGAGNLIFSSNNAINVGINPSLDANGNIVFTGGPTINRALGSINKNLASVKFTASTTTTRASLNKDIYASNLEFSELTVGIDDDLNFRMPVTTTNTTFDLTNKSLSLNNKLTNTDANGAVTIKGMGTLTFNFDNVIDAAIVPESDGVDGNIVFSGGPDLRKQLGAPDKRLASVKFTSLDPNTRIRLNNNIYTKQNTIEFGQQIVEPGGNITLGGNVKTDNTTFELGLNIVTIEGDLSHENAAGGLKINTTYDGTTAGHFVMAGSSNVNLSNSSNLTFKVTETHGLPLPAAGKERRIDIFVTNGGNLSFVNNDKVVIDASSNPNSKYVSWSFDAADGALVQKLIVAPEEIIPDIIGGGGDPTPSNPTPGNPVNPTPVNPGNLSPINPGNPGNPAPVNPSAPTPVSNVANIPPALVETIRRTDTALTKDLANLGVSAGREALVESFVRMETVNPSAVAMGNRGHNLSQAGTSAVETRLADLSQNISTNSSTLAYNDTESGMSAGDKATKYGVWFSPFVAQNTQKIRKNTPGYKSTYYGGVLGFDSAINDRMVLGGAFSTIYTDIKHTDQNQGDKTAINTNIIYVYGSYDLSDKWFVQNITAVGRSHVKNRELRREFRGYSIAKANYKSDFFSTELLTGYDFNIKPGILLTPTVGINYSRNSNINYRESGTELQNFIVKAKGTQQVEAIAGIRLEASYLLKNGLRLSPDIHSDIGYLLVDEASKTDVRNERVPDVEIETRSVKPAKYIYSFGAGIGGQTTDDRWDYNVSYDCRLSDKFIAHQGTLKVRLNF